MQGKLDFYNTILNIEITTVTLFFAAYFLFVQSFIRKHNLKHVGLVLSDIFLWVSLILFIFTISISSGIVFFRGKISSDVWGYEEIKILLSSFWFTLSVFSAFIFSKVFLIIYIFKNIKTLTSNILLEKLLKRWKAKRVIEQIQNLILKREKEDYVPQIEISDDDKIIVTNPGAKEKTREKPIEFILPHNTLISLLRKYINQQEIPDVIELLSATRKFHKNLFNDIQQSSIEGEFKNKLCAEIILDFINSFSRAWQICLKENDDISFKELINCIFDVLINYTETLDMGNVVALFSRIERHFTYYHSFSTDGNFLILNRASSLGVNILKFEVEKGINISISNAIFREFGRCAEVITANCEIRRRPMMLDTSMEVRNEIEWIFDAFCNFLQYFPPKEYPSVLFDALTVFTLSLLERQSKNADIPNLQDRMYDIINHLCTFSIDALAIGNSRGACFVILSIREILRKISDLNVSINLEDIFSKLLQLGFRSLFFKQNSTCDFLHTPIYEEVVKFCIDFGKGINFNKIIDHYYREPNEIESNFEYIKYLGKEMKTNFDMMFDWESGDFYPDNDPRRKI